MKPLIKSFLIFFFLFSVLCSLFSAPAGADIPRLITYQGKLTDPQGKPVEDKAHSITLLFIKTSSGIKALRKL